MMPIGPIYEYIVEACFAQHDADKKKRVWRELNHQYGELCRAYSWADLRAPHLTLDFTTAGASGLWLPSDVFGIDFVWDDDNEVEFTETEEADAQPDENGYRFIRNMQPRTSLFEGADLVLEEGATEFTSDSLTAAGTDVDGEYVRFGAEPGYYLISSASTPFTFTPTYHGPQLSQKEFSVRPWQSTKKMTLVDPDEDLLTDRTVKVYYWRAPVPLYRLSDMAVLPTLEILKLRTLRAMWDSKATVPVSQNALDEALKDALKANPRFRRPSVARDLHNRKVDFSTSPFGERR
ncbi:MAG: hypothetical protein IT479_13330 [Xanthomonadales bacterium]|nr:hypothetical protein [Xanthomonadales bacterium]